MAAPALTTNAAAHKIALVQVFNVQVFNVQVFNSLFPSKQMSQRIAAGVRAAQLHNHRRGTPAQKVIEI